MAPPFRLLVIADVGGDSVRHVGDEAMLLANLDGFRSAIPNVEISVISRDPKWVTEHLGVPAVPLFGFSGEPGAGVERAALLSRLLNEVTGGNGAYATLDALRHADAVVVSGGGNLSSSWPDLLHERTALLLLADALGKPSVVLGQTIGPRLTDEDRRLIAGALPLARFTGVREIPSVALAMSLGVPSERVWLQCDDAIFFANPRGTAPSPGRGAPPSIAVTIDPQIRAAGGDLFTSLASQLRELAEATGASLVLVPHAFGDEGRGAPSDLTECRLLAEAIAIPSTTVAANLDALAAARIAHAATIVISSRYHPLVFALSAATPCIGIYGDEYCRIKLQGAFAHAGRERWALTYDDVKSGALITLAREQWRERDALRDALAMHHEEWRAESRQRWFAIARALLGGAVTAPGGENSIFGRQIADALPALISTIALGREAWERGHDAWGQGYAAWGEERAAWKRARESWERDCESWDHGRKSWERDREELHRLAARCREVEEQVLALEATARPYLTVRRRAAGLLSWLRRLLRGG